MGSVYSPVGTLFCKSVDLGWTQDPYVGNGCIRYNDWEAWTVYEIDFLNPMISLTPLSDFECADNLDSGYHWDII